MREYEHDFELAIVFNSIKNLPGYGGCLKKTDFRVKNEENSTRLREARDKAEYERLRKQFEAK